MMQKSNDQFMQNKASNDEINTYVMIYNCVFRGKAKFFLLHSSRLFITSKNEKFCDLIKIFQTFYISLFLQEPR